MKRIHPVKSLGAVILTFGLLAAAVPLRAHAVTDHRIKYQGNACVSSPSASTAGHNFQGIYNPSSSAEMYVYCPMPIEKLSSTSQSLYYVGIGGYDRNTTYDIVCNILAQNTDGSFSNFGAFSTTGGGPGSGWTGAGLFTSTLPGLGTEALYLECVIPRSQSGWLSHVNYYEVFYQTP